jgi:hypothetical protein
VTRVSNRDENVARKVIAEFIAASLAQMPLLDAVPPPRRKKVKRPKVHHHPPPKPRSAFKKPPKPIVIPSPWASKKIEFLVQRDGPYCWLCNGEVLPSDVPPEGHHPRSYSPTLDHVRPKVEGGGNERSNLRLAHYFCNNQRKSLSPHDGWLRVKEFARKRDPALTRWDVSPARDASMPAPTKPVPEHYLRALREMEALQATAVARKTEKALTVKATMIGYRIRLRDGLPLNLKEASALLHTSIHWKDVVEPLTTAEMVSCIEVMVAHQRCTPTLVAFAKSKGVCGICTEVMSLLVKGDAKVILWRDGTGVHSYCAQARKVG